MTDATERSSMERAGLKNVQYAQQQQVTCDPSKNYFGGGGSWELGGGVGGVVAAKLYSWTHKLRAGVDSTLKKPALEENRDRVLPGWAMGSREDYVWGLFV